MALGIRLEQKQIQQLVVTPQLQRAIKLLQMSNLELRAFVEAEIEQNPLLRLEEATSEEDGAPADFAADVTEAPLDARLTEAGDYALARETLDTGTENLFDTGPADASARPAAGAGGSLSFEPFEIDRDPPDRPATLRAHLLAQLGQRRADPLVAAIGRLIVEELDEHGYFRADLGEFGGRLGAAPETTAAALGLVQSCEPTGVGARDLAECLALQLAERDRLDPAMRALVDNLDVLARGARRRLRALCGVDEADFADMLAELRSLDPRPCAGFAPDRAETLIPDLFLRRAPGGGWEIELNPETLPRVIEDTRYAVTLARGGPEARAFIAECRAGASWLRRSLDQRARTILKVASEIVRRQERFFAVGVAGLRPLTLRMVAEVAGLHESTVSRVTANKYIATERGVLELKFFFTNAIGAEDVAAAAVRHRIRAIVDGEAPGSVLSDDEIVGRLQQVGVQIARRTVAKYRRMIGIPSSAERRRLQALAGPN